MKLAVVTAGLSQPSSTRLLADRPAAFTAGCSGLFTSFFDVLDRDSLVGKPVPLAATGGTERQHRVERAGAGE